MQWKCYDSWLVKEVPGNISCTASLVWSRKGCLYRKKSRVWAAIDTNKGEKEHEEYSHINTSGNIFFNSNISFYDKDSFKLCEGNTYIIFMHLYVSVFHEESNITPAPPLFLLYWVGQANYVPLALDRGIQPEEIIRPCLLQHS